MKQIIYIKCVNIVKILNYLIATIANVVDIAFYEWIIIVFGFKIVLVKIIINILC
jgi:hypothetical protein